MWHSIALSNFMAMAGKAEVIAVTFDRDSAHG